MRVFYQVAAIPLAIVAIAAGLRRAQPEMVVIGTLFAGAFVLVRFVGWWWDWMPKYLFFLIVAATAVSGLWLLRVLRRRLEGAMA
jgi:hypothetical protein